MTPAKLQYYQDRFQHELNRNSFLKALCPNHQINKGNIMDELKKQLTRCLWFNRFTYAPHNGFHPAYRTKVEQLPFTQDQIKQHVLKRMQNETSLRA